MRSSEEEREEPNFSVSNSSKAKRGNQRILAKKTDVDPVAVDLVAKVRNMTRIATGIDATTPSRACPSQSSSKRVAEDWKIPKNKEMPAGLSQTPGTLKN